MELDQNYWNTRYATGSTAWDLNQVSPPLKAYINQLEDKSLKILIPGGGFSYEAQYLWEHGFKNVFVVDFSKLALESLKKSVPDFPKAQLLQANFFDINDTFDLILEQTFFCAQDPSLRSAYVNQMGKLLKKQGKLVGLLFNFPISEKGPPFGGSISAYKKYFNKLFDIQILETAYNSVKSRDGEELFIKLVKK